MGREVLKARLLALATKPLREIASRERLPILVGQEHQVLVGHRVDGRRQFGSDAALWHLAMAPGPAARHRSGASERGMKNPRAEEANQRAGSDASVGRPLRHSRGRRESVNRPSTIGAHAAGRRGNGNARQHPSVVRQRCHGPAAGRHREPSKGH